MFLNRRIGFLTIFQFAWRVQMYALAVSLVVYVLYEDFDIQQVAIPFLPVATIGTAVAFYVGFKNNSAYDRLWEGRRIWGSITNGSRMWSASVNSWIGSRAAASPAINDLKKQLLYRHLAWINMLRLQLRRRPIFSERKYVMSAQFNIIRKTHGELNFEKEASDLAKLFLAAGEQEHVLLKPNFASHLLHLQTQQILESKNKGLLDGWEHAELSKLILEFYNQQGAAERIKSFPFPRQYANFSTIFVYIFIALLPFAIINDLDKLGNNTSWLVVPFTMLIAWVFNVMEQVGDASENPFDNGINDVPMTAICRNIEIEFRDVLGETNLPARVQPVNGILM